MSSYTAHFSYFLGLQHLKKPKLVYLYRYYLKNILISRIYFQGYLKSFGFFAKVLGMSPNKMENYQGSVRENHICGYFECSLLEQDFDYIDDTQQT